MRMKKNLLLVLTLALALVVSACATQPAGPTPAPTTPSTPAPAPAAPKYGGLKQVEIATATQGGGFHVLGTALAPLLEKSLGIPVVATTSEGSSENIALVERGEVPLSMVTGSILYEAWAGEGNFKAKNQNGRLLYVFYPSNAFFITRADSGITKISDLKGKRVGIGPSSATWSPRWAMAR